MKNKFNFSNSWFLVLLITIMLLSINLGYAEDDGISIERRCSNFTEEYDCDGLEEFETERNYLVCPKCDNGQITRAYETWGDRQHVQAGHWGSSCQINKAHYMRWYFDVLLINCNSCNFQERTILSGDYGWYCTPN